MPDWEREIRKTIARLHLDLAREESIVAELARSGPGPEASRIRADMQRAPLGLQQ